MPDSGSTLCWTAVPGDLDSGQRTGVLRDGAGCVGRSAWDDAALHPAGEAGPERVYLKAATVRFEMSA